MEDDGKAIARSSACLVLPVRVRAEDADHCWQPGPLPLPYPSADASVRTTAEVRQTYFQSRIVSALYERRWHRCVEVPIGKATLTAVEVVALPHELESSLGVVVFHVELGSQPERELTVLSRRAGQDGAVRDALVEHLPDGVTFEGSPRRAWTLAHTTFKGAAVPLSDNLPWPASQQWLWLLASGTDLGDYPPHADDESLFAGRTKLSADWEALALRDGWGFVGLSPDAGGRDGYHCVASVLVHTVYLDLFLLSRLQLLMLNELADSLADRGSGHMSWPRLNVLQIRMAIFRKTLWWESVSVFGRANELLEIVQKQARLPELFEHVLRDLTDVATLAEAVAARRTNAMLALLTVVGLPFGLAYAAVVTVTVPSPALFGIATGIGAAVALMLLVTVSSLRVLISDLFGRTRRSDR